SQRRGRNMSISVMETRQLGQTDLQVSVLGFSAEPSFAQLRPDLAASLLNEALDAGLSVIDAGGPSLPGEELIGRAVAHRRQDYSLFARCGRPEGPGAADWRPDAQPPGSERSLRRLRTDRLDLVQLDGCSEGELRRGDVIAPLRRARELGYARYIGYCGDGRAARYAVACGAFDALQTSVSI